tara:strand:+ start:1017 stop:1313 length:297 start_codon:yes stop_codon:yes gene_type:complete
MGRTANINNIDFKEDEDIYIDCRPVDTKGVTIMDDEANTQVINTNDLILDELSVNIGQGNILESVGFQTALGIVLLGILYGIGSYVFKKLPQNYIENN